MPFESFTRISAGPSLTVPGLNTLISFVGPSLTPLSRRISNRQLAEVLYEIRNYFDAELLQSPERLGEKIEAYSWRASSRFQELAEQHLLVGQIATSLLLTEEEESSSLILPATRRRIATDLDVERRSRDWLNDARQHATTVRLRGLGGLLKQKRSRVPPSSLTMGKTVPANNSRNSESNLALPCTRLADGNGMSDCKSQIYLLCYRNSRISETVW